MNAACNAGKRARQAECGHLAAERRNAHHLGDVLIVTDREQAGAELGAIDPARRQQRDDGERQREQIERRRNRWPNARNRHSAQIDARSAVDRRVEHDRADHERDGERDEREELAAQPSHAEDHGAERDSQQRGDQRREWKCPEKRHGIARGDKRRRIHAGAEKSAVSERKIARVAGQDVPRRRENDPVQHEIKERFIERREAKPGKRGEQQARDGDRHEGPVSMRKPSHGSGCLRFIRSRDEQQDQQ